MGILFVSKGENPAKLYSPRPIATTADTIPTMLNLISSHIAGKYLDFQVIEALWNKSVTIDTNSTRRLLFQQM